MLASTVVLVLLILFVAPSGPGEPLVAREVTSGEVFEVTFASNGRPARVFVDMECEACSLPVEGHLEVTAAGQRVKHVEISAGSREAFASRNRLREQFITEVPAVASAVPVTVRGRLSVHSERGLLSFDPSADAPVAIVRALRVTIAP